MDSDAFRETYQAINALACPYEKSLLTNNAGCALARKFCIAEREGVRCDSAEARARCLELLERLRSQARFALKSTDTSGALPHAKAMRIQVGGLRGLLAVLEPGTPIPNVIPDISAVLAAALSRFGTLEALPYSRILREVAAYQGRQGSRRRR